MNQIINWIKSKTNKNKSKINIQNKKAKSYRTNRHRYTQNDIHIDEYVIKQSNRYLFSTLKWEK